MSKNTKGDDNSIALAIKEMENKESSIRRTTKRIASNGFTMLPHGNTGMVHIIALSAEEAMKMDSLLSRGVTNSIVLLRDKFGYDRSKSSLDMFKEKHSHLIPAPRELEAA